MPVQAIPLALVASIYPIGLAALLVLLRTSRPRALSGAFLCGAAVCTLGVGFAVVSILDGAGLRHSGATTPRYSLRLGIGVALVVAALLLRRRPPRPAHHQPSGVARAVNNASLWTAFLLGILLYTPSPAYLTALEVVGTTKLTTAQTAAWVVIVAAAVLLTLELPFLLFSLAPDWTTARVEGVDLWIKRNGRRALTDVLFVLGVWEISDGLVGLLS